MKIFLSDRVPPAFEWDVLVNSEVLGSVCNGRIPPRPAIDRNVYWPLPFVLRQVVAAISERLHHPMQPEPCWGAGHREEPARVVQPACGSAISPAANRDDENDDLQTHRIHLPATRSDIGSDAHDDADAAA